MPNEAYEVLYNRVLDVSAVIHFPFKLFTMAIVIRYTPADIRYLSYFLLDEMMWNLVGNTVFAFIHLHPMFPAECFRAESIVSFLDGNEVLDHTMFFVLLLCVPNCGIAISSTFHYRYIIFAFPQQASNIKPSWVIALCAAVHLCSVPTFCYLYLQWIVPYSSYPLKEELPQSGGLFCFKPFGWEKIAFVAFLSTIVVLTGSGLVSAALLLRSIENKKGSLHKGVLNKHKEVIYTFLAVMCVPIFFGGFPFMCTVMTCLYPHLPYARWVYMISVVAVANHGSLQAIVLIFAVRPYRKAALKILHRLFPFGTKVTTL
ncbi:hypothetical protein QR680_007974 [Steinernema hermaphroditum]|uniref:Uncharacterized protein n=1 Tax=Steinernema hermaphroditum TaxID=289476 RepID=A0AA39M668_9BILA|nr:hypothetical protein QR680_007974 [Steinernema hermaphroditum]